MSRRNPLILLAALAAGCATTATTTPPPVPREPAPAPVAATAASGICATSAILVNSCRPWLGSDIRWVDVPAGPFPAIARDEQPYLLLNWRPAPRWAEVTEARIDEAASGIRSIAPRKVFLALHVAPEADVTNAVGCDHRPGAAGTPAEYRQMWKRVRDRFDASGTTNVVWVLGYANDPEWDCLVPELYPGDRYVDWIIFGGPAVARFQRLLMGMNGPDRQVLTKPWGVYGVADKRVPNIRAYLTAPG